MRGLFMLVMIRSIECVRGLIIPPSELRSMSVDSLPNPGMPSFQRAFIWLLTAICRYDRYRCSRQAAFSFGEHKDRPSGRDSPSRTQAPGSRVGEDQAGPQDGFVLTRPSWIETEGCRRYRGCYAASVSSSSHFHSMRIYLYI
jgi:hypothetical protein